MVAQAIFYTKNRDSDDNLYVRYLYFNDGAWNRNYNWLDNDWNGTNPAALLANYFISLLFLLESFVLSVVQSIRQVFCRFHLF